MFPLFGGIGGMANPFGYGMSPMLGQLGLLAMMRQRMEQGDAQQQPSFEQQPAAPVEEPEFGTNPPIPPDLKTPMTPDISTNGQQRMVVNGTLNLSPEKGGIATLNPISAEPLPQPGFITPRPGARPLQLIQARSLVNQAYPAMEEQFPRFFT